MVALLVLFGSGDLSYSVSAGPHLVCLSSRCALSFASFSDSLYIIDALIAVRNFVLPGGSVNVLAV